MTGSRYIDAQQLPVFTRKDRRVHVLDFPLRHHPLQLQLDGIGEGIIGGLARGIFGISNVHQPVVEEVGMKGETTQPRSQAGFRNKIVDQRPNVQKGVYFPIFDPIDDTVLIADKLHTIARRMSAHGSDARSGSFFISRGWYGHVIRQLDAQRTGLNRRGEAFDFCLGRFHSQRRQVFCLGFVVDIGNDGFDLGLFQILESGHHQLVFLKLSHRSGITRFNYLGGI